MKAHWAQKKKMLMRMDKTLKDIQKKVTHLEHMEKKEMKHHMKKHKKY